MPTSRCTFKRVIDKLKKETILVDMISFEEWLLGLGLLNLKNYWKQLVKQAHSFSSCFWSTFYILANLHNSPLKKILSPFY